MATAAKLRCRICGGSSGVLITRIDPGEGGRIRRHHCSGCNRRWWSYQPPMEELPDWAVQWLMGEATVNHEALAAHRRSQRL